MQNTSPYGIPMACADCGDDVQDSNSICPDCGAFLCEDCIDSHDCDDEYD